MNRVILRAAETRDALCRLSALAHEIWREHYPPIIGRAQVEYMLAEGYSSEALMAERAAGTRFTLALDADRGALGFAALSPDPSDTRRAWLDKLYVHAARRGTGAGRALVDRVRAQARAVNAECLWLRVNRDNTAAIAAYRRMGFVCEGTDVKDIGHGFVMDDYVMAAEL